ncbi:solute:Na+ symporter, SSS family [Arachidicoccus rhizosphaerae]|uniref:Solute:Na+ symporter, SSS family n=1 Tax=Arachidicoccus rhizosphaerae TaxID=551991 RepID=A0A1H3ZSA8_9BACT|nr:sodium/solute symporter [Arachidicoccus rhizosphaerae]SEA26653.1 solute:Na+ symporter, SSS family [Arachidicoccus rhizosphaerae]
MKSGLIHIDYIIIVAYFLLITFYGLWIYRKRKNKDLSSHDYFLAEGSLTWWAIGASIIASNISAEQFIGMSGDGFFVGIAVGVYEWVGALGLIIIAVWFLPIYLKNKIFTMPQFLKRRFNGTVALIMAIFWLMLYVFVNITSILYLGALAVNTLVGGQSLHLIMVIFAICSVLIALGGMKVIGYTDAIQVAMLLIGGLATTYFALQVVSEKFGLGKDVFAGFKAMMDAAPQHFHLIYSKPTASSSQHYIDQYLIVPGILMYIAGQWIVNLEYFGTNQYITQRALGANLKTARTGLMFAGILKMFTPIVVMLPGIAAYVLYQKGFLPDLGGHKDHAYSAVLGFLPNGLKGLSIAALSAAIIASLAGKANSISTIYTLDIYKNYFHKEATDKKMVWIGRIAVVISMAIGLFFTWDDILGIGGAGGFTFIQKYTGFISPGVLAVFLLGMFWKRTNGLASIVGIVGGFVLCVFFNEFAPAMLGNNTWFYTAYPNGHGGYEIPFLICMGLAFGFTVVLMVICSMFSPKVNPKAFVIDRKMYKVEPSVLVLIVVIMMLFAALYAKFW